MLNVEKARADKVYGNDKLHPGHHRAGRRSSGDDFDVTKLRYHKVIIMADADVDGCAHPHPAADLLLPLHAPAH